ncbi:MAG: 40S ribosomal protein S19 [Chaenotheca gracillima]|nr:MAG: 40S ribosomal protein S19 [Chaenotheca gracillima]
MAPKFDINTKYRMNSGYEIPVLGYGVYQTPPDITEEVTLHALKSGYRHVDSAVFYHNEEPCGEAIKKSGIARDQIFFTSKIPPYHLGYDASVKWIEDSLKKTGLGYIDLYLIHAPFGGKEARLGAWDAMVDAQKAGKIKSLGVSNYGVHHLDELEEHIKQREAKEGKGAGGAISVGQWELHPWLARPDIAAWCEKRGVILEAYCPLVRAQRNDHPLLQSLAKKHGKTSAQVLIRWSIQKGFVPLPKSVTLSRIEENAKVYDFELSPEDMKTLDTGAYDVVAWDPTTSHD